MTDSEILATLRAVKDAYPRAWDKAHLTGEPERLDFIILAGKRLYAESGSAIGCNWRRAVQGDLSADGLSITGGDGRYYFVDVIRSAKDHPNDPWTPELVYHAPGADALLRDGAGNYAPHGFADPRPLKTHFKYDDVIEPPPSERCPDPSAHTQPRCPKPSDHTKPPYAGDAAALAFGERYIADVTQAGQSLNTGSWIWASRVYFDHYVGGMTLADAIKKQREHPTEGWLRAMGLS